MIKCGCGMVIVKNGGGQVTCRRCQSLVYVPPDTLRSVPCIHRGEHVGMADCGCCGQADVYACRLKTHAMKRKLRPGLVTVQIGDDRKRVEMGYCATCEHELKLPATQPAKDCVIITPHFNPAGSRRIEETLNEWLATVADCDVIIERADGGPQNVMWQKERLINRAIERLPASVKYVAWCDHDICFERADWLVESCRMIDNGIDAMQPFETAKYRGKKGDIDRTAKSATSVAVKGGKPQTGPGACWVASREWLDRIGGIYDRNIVGGGDAVFFEAVSGLMTSYRDRQSKASRSHLESWIAGVGPTRIGYLPGSVHHLWHGDFRNRQYVSRDAIMRRYEFDPELHVEVDAQGLLAWTDAAQQAMRDEVAEYFAARRDDG